MGGHDCDADRGLPNREPRDLALECGRKQACVWSRPRSGHRAPGSRVNSAERVRARRVCPSYGPNSPMARPGVCDRPGSASRRSAMRFIDRVGRGAQPRPPDEFGRALRSGLACAGSSRSPYGSRPLGRGRPSVVARKAAPRRGHRLRSRRNGVRQQRPGRSTWRSCNATSTSTPLRRRPWRS